MTSERVPRLHKVLVHVSTIIVCTVVQTLIMQMKKTTYIDLHNQQDTLNEILHIYI